MWRWEDVAEWMRFVSVGGGVSDRGMLHRCFFFFQAEDGIRDVAVTGVQTCALPISNPARKAVQKELRRTRAHLAKLREEYATVPRDLSRLARKRAKKELRAEIQQTTDTIKKLRARHHSLPRRVPVAQTQKEESGETLHRAQAPHRRSEDGRLPSGYC